jgi:PHS family inorganic phosphate transporter-like MFS transporter
MLIIFATIMTLTTPTGALSPSASLIYLTIFRIVLGVGVGGDYPMSASVASDRASIRRRGTLLAYVFANQGWGSFVGSVVVMVVLAAYKSRMGEGTGGVDGVWRIAVGVSLVPAFGTLYQRLTLPESTRYKESRRRREGKGVEEGEGAGAEVEEDVSADEKKKTRGGDVDESSVEGSSDSGTGKAAKVKQTAVKKKAHFKGEGLHQCQCARLESLTHTGLSSN